ncbi:MAG: winged helix-turn-helix transcriptional regulator [Burkholderiales bacterium]|nr:winged helix-turn-helix transcriptional regulator [Burkholderiales bacterium]
MTITDRSPSLRPRPREAAPAASPTGCSSFKLRQLSRRVSQRFDAELGMAGLKTTQYSLLSHIVRLGPVRPGRLAAAMAMDASTLTRNLQPLLAQGLAVLEAGDDGRSRQVQATALGLAKRAEAQRAWKRAQLAFNGRIGAERVARLHALIDECLALLEQDGSAEAEPLAQAARVAGR